ncbi:hypothetical protein R5W23_004489 [Gemmata sp. JC673]|uniref:Helix-turn-helix domain-containing protein n=1 Tax=Gemmata algarum TaxID=2975278 RepID=A0ABU5FB03_9BACT|nr:hypothetical protein [Gemmata algarum]MDY3563006.1 hypothetical protein [Gemmata algarum]
MARALQPLWLLLASATDSQLTSVVEYLKAEDRILRDKLPDRVSVTARERERLLKLGQPLGSALRAVVTIVSYRTFCRWMAGTKESGSTAKKTSDRKPGRPKTAEDVRDLILKLRTNRNHPRAAGVRGLVLLGAVQSDRAGPVHLLQAEDAHLAGAHPGQSLENHHRAEGGVEAG